MEGNTRAPRIRAAAQLQAQEAAHRLTSAAIAGSAARVASGRTRSQTPSNGSTRAPSAGSTASSLEVRHAQSPSASGAALPVMRLGSPSVASAEVVLDANDEAAPGVGPVPGVATTAVVATVEATAVGFATALASHRQSPETGSPHGPSQSPDALDLWMLREELRRTSAALARAIAMPEVVNSLDLPGLAALRTELVTAHAAALERVDDRRVTLQARQASAQEGPERGRCVACWSRCADRVLLPCRHLCLCGSCLRSCRTTCPICRGPVADTMEVFGVV
mmetsp:Transcript_47587/g.151880  ORF Transcript_47587/g.151880 Transcript_47587/m.151880 type:complete len:279 (-) Transcript_47587:96-932(-)